MVSPITNCHAVYLEACRYKKRRDPGCVFDLSIPVTVVYIWIHVEVSNRGHDADIMADAVSDTETKIE